MQVHGPFVYFLWNHIFRLSDPANIYIVDRLLQRSFLREGALEVLKQVLFGLAFVGLIRNALLVVRLLKALALEDRARVDRRWVIRRLEDARASLFPEVVLFNRVLLQCLVVGQLAAFP